ncbi:MAG: hypothetical protein ACR2GF_03320 [Acidimicrobiales bacterium]
MSPPTTAATARKARVGWRREATNTKGTVIGAATIAPPIDTNKKAATARMTNPTLAQFLSDPPEVLVTETILTRAGDRRQSAVRPGGRRSAMMGE